MQLFRYAAAAVLVALLMGCGPRSLIINGMADGLAAQGMADEDDLTLAREASAFYLKLSESVLRETPAHRALAEAVAGSFTKYAYAFVAFEAERLEARDARGAQQLRARAARLYDRARRHAMQALAQGNPGFADRLERASRSSGAKLALPAADARLAYWAAAAWGAHIALSKDRPEVVADLPQVVALASATYAASPDLGEGALASLMGTLESARPGGNLAQARAYFNRALAASQGRSAAVLTAMAESLAQPAGDRQAYADLLQQALAQDTAPRDLDGQVMRLRAQWLLDTIDDRF